MWDGQRWGLKSTASACDAALHALSTGPTTASRRARAHCTYLVDVARVRVTLYIRAKRRHHLQRAKLLPVNVCEERVAFRLLITADRRTKPVGRIAL